MVQTKTLLASLAFAVGTQAAAYPSDKVCKDYTIKVPVSYDVTGFFYPHWTTNIGLTDFIGSATAWNAMQVFLPNVLKPNGRQSRTYTISATVCNPRTTQANEKKVLLATHGLGFDRRYWDIGYQPSKYNFVDYAINQGYSVFYYDRLGVSKSQKVSGYLNQPSIQAAILKQLALYIKNGQYTGRVGKPTQTIFVGHSFGSELSQFVQVNNPGLVDALVLTGIDYNKTIIDPAAIILGQGGRVAKTVNPKAFGALDTGYIANVDIYAFQSNFFHEYFDRRALKYAFGQATASSIMEQLLQMTLITNAASVTVPVLVVSATYDFFFCGNDCRGVTQGAAAAQFPNSKDFEFYMVPSAGHGINYSPNATLAYNAITTFLDKNF